MSDFTGIITSEHKTLFTDMIDALLEDTALTVPCKLIYGNTKFTECDNCILDVLSKKSANIYRVGGPIPFTSGQPCPRCDSVGFIPVESFDEDVYMGVIWDYKKWIGFDSRIRSPEGLVQTLTKITLLPKIKRAKEVIFNTDIEGYKHHRFIREGEPTPLGWGNDSYIITMWKNAG